MRRVALGVFLLVVTAATADARREAANKPVRTALPGGGYQLTTTWPMAHGVKGELVQQFSKEGHLSLSQRATYGNGKRVTYRHTRYDPDGTVHERGLYKVWQANGVRFSISKRFDRDGHPTYADQYAKGPNGRIYERQVYGGMIDVTRSWIAKKTRFYVYKRKFISGGSESIHRYGGSSKND